MTALELKSQIIQDIGNEQNSVILEKLQRYYRKLKNAEKRDIPCQYTLEELNGRLDRAEQEAENGGGTQHDVFMRETGTWF